MTDRELFKHALGVLDQVAGAMPFPVALQVRAALRERLAQPEQEFTTHEEGEDGWSDWVCPDPKSYLMKCCDCGLVHEAQFAVVRYKSETEREDCDMVDDPNLQAVFRMRRSEQWTPKDTAYRPGGLAQPEQEPVIDKSAAIRIATALGWEPRREWVGLTDEEIALVCGECAASAHRADDISYARAIEAKLKEKNT